MPRQADIRRNQRPAQGPQAQPQTVDVNQQNLYIDNYRAPQGPQRAQQFASALESFSSAMHHADSGLFADMRREKEEKGAIAGFLGVDVSEVPDDSPDLAYRTRDKIKGKAATAQFKTQLDEYFRQNRDATPGQFMAGVQKLKEGFLKGQTRSFISGFLPFGMEYESSLNGAYFDYQVEKDTNAFLDELGGAAQAELVRMANDPTINGETRAYMLHTMVQHYQQLGKEYRGIDRDVINAKIIDTIGTLAHREGRPDWMDFTLLKDPDGVALWDTKSKDKIADFISGAETQRDARIAAEKKAAKEAVEAAEDSAARAIIDASLSDSPGQWQKAEEFMLKNKQLFDPEKYEKYREIFYNLRTDAGGEFFASRSSESIFTRLLVRADDNSLDIDTLSSPEVKAALTRQDWLKVFERTQAAKEKARNEAKVGKDKTPLEKAEADGRTNIKGLLTISGGIGEKIMTEFGTPLTQLRADKGQQIYHELMESRKKERGAEFNFEDLTWVKRKAMHLAFVAVPPMNKSNQPDVSLIPPWANDPDMKGPQPSPAASEGGKATAFDHLKGDFNQ